jgi:resuscitation-promoting factor RpfA
VGRVVFIVMLVAATMATGVAMAAPVSRVRVPTDVGGAPDRGESVVVAPGDHLWKISARHLEGMSAEMEVAPYWRTVVEVNTPTLRSGDPDLIFPGEVIELPPISGRP